MSDRHVGIDLTAADVDLSDAALDEEGETGVALTLPNPDGEYANELLPPEQPDPLGLLACEDPDCPSRGAHGLHFHPRGPRNVTPKRDRGPKA